MKKIFALFFFTISFSQLKSQSLDSMLHVYASDYGQQKVHMHFDKTVYRVGENIWFKAYLFEGFSPSLRSNNFYAELLNDSGRIVDRKVYPVFQSSAAGNFDLPINLSAGKYAVRGYTTWMLNFDTAFIFKQSFSVVAKDGNADNIRKETPIASSYGLTLFPEGGDLVNDLESVVGYKANDNLGLPFSVKGKIVDSKGNEITTFSSAHNGMGKFLLTPVAGENYFAVWNDLKGNERSIALPAAKSQGYVLKISSLEGRVIFSVKRTEQVPANNKAVYMVATLGGERVYRVKIDMESITVTSGSIPVKNLPAGVLQLTLFSANWDPLAERVTIINNENYSFSAEVHPLLLDVNKRAKNDFEIEIKDTLLTNLSIAVIDDEVSRQKFASNIISTMLLTGDIKGYVHEPAYYFSDTTDSVKMNLDLIMLTHGWRRFNWERIIAGKTPRLKYPADHPLSFKAKVYGMVPGTQLQADEALIAIIQAKDSTTKVLQIPRSSKDEFANDQLIVYDTLKVYYQFSKDNKLAGRTSVAFEPGNYLGYQRANPATLMLQQPTDTFAVRRISQLAINDDRYGAKFTDGSNVLGNVTVRTKTKSRLEILDEQYANGMFKDDNGYSFDFSEFQNSAVSIFTFLQGRVPGLQVTEQNGTATLSWRGNSPSLFLDEMSVDAENLASINVSNIAYVKVFRPPFFGAFGGGAGGAIAIYTRKGNDVKYTPGKGLPRGIIAGYSVSKQFYSPDYTNKSASDDVAADYRSTLYWNPVIFTDGTRQKTNFKFYNNDITRAFRVVLQGFNEIGQLVYFEKVFTK